MNPEDLLGFTKKQLIEELEKLNLVYDETMANLVMIREEILHRLKQEKKDGEIVGDYQLRKSVRVTFKTSLEEAEELGAVKKAVDTQQLKNLSAQGVKIPGMKKTVYLSVRKLQNETKE